NVAGNFIVAFTVGASTPNQNVYVQRFTSVGTPVGSAIAVAATAHSENQPSAAIDIQGDFVVAYTLIRATKGIDNFSEVHAALYKNQGTLVKNDTVWTSAKVTESAYDPSAAMDAAGNYMVGYTRGANDGPYDPSAGPPSVWASAYSHTGALVQAGIN